MASLFGPSLSKLNFISFQVIKLGEIQSCLASLLDYYEKILEVLKNGGNVDSLFLDFEKAFDKVDHGILCHKLKEKGIIDNTGRWIQDFLMISERIGTRLS